MTVVFHSVMMGVDVVAMRIVGAQQLPLSEMWCAGWRQLLRPSIDDSMVRRRCATGYIAINVVNARRGEPVCSPATQGIDGIVIWRCVLPGSRCVSMCIVGDPCGRPPRYQ